MKTKISYYELLELVKNKQAPEEISVNLTGNREVKYIADYDGLSFSHYFIENLDEKDGNYHHYLAENFLESGMFDRCITILDEKPKKIEELDLNIDKFEDSYYDTALLGIADRLEKITKAVNYLLEKESDK